MIAYHVRLVWKQIALIYRFLKVVAHVQKVILMFKIKKTVNSVQITAKLVLKRKTCALLVDKIQFSLMNRDLVYVFLATTLKKLY